MCQKRCVMGTGPQSLNKEASHIRVFFWKTTAKFEQTRSAGKVNGRCGGYFVAGTIPLLAMSGDGIIGFGMRLIRKEASSNE